MLAGIGGTGKSTYARSLNLDGITKIVSSDEIRYSITGAYNILLDDMNIVYNKMIETANKYLREYDDINVILDSTFLDDNRRNYFIDRLEGYEKLDLIMLKAHDNSIIFKRNHMRIKEKWVPLEVLEKMIKKYQNPSEEYINRYSSIREVFIDE